ncbi:class I SAM-dependent methyltransferase [Streptomyces albus subsp. chlorinus]|nr:class I SAM-dependent methyltransferase [Streptomyces albus subsp. chlorinus]
MMTTPPSDVSVAVRRNWDERARRWLDYDDDMERFAAPLGELALERLGPCEGARIIEVGCGTGGCLHTLAQRVGDTGRVTGVDIAAPMVEHARRSVANRANVEVLHADASTHRFEPEHDAVFSRFGMMFFPHPESAFRNIARALRPGGKIAFVCWDGIRTNEWFMITGLAAMSVTRAPLAPARRAPFSLSNPERLRELLAQAGFHSVHVARRVEKTVMSEEDLETRLKSSLEVTGLRETLRGLPQDVRRRAVDAVREALWARVSDGRIALRVGVLVAEATR